MRVRTANNRKRAKAHRARWKIRFPRGWRTHGLEGVDNLAAEMVCSLHSTFIPPYPGEVLR